MNNHNEDVIAEASSTVSATTTVGDETTGDIPTDLL
jgi:hypothetical protein